MYSRLSVDTEKHRASKARALSKHGHKRACVRRDTKVEEDEKVKGEGEGDVCVIPERGLLVLPRVRARYVYVCVYMRVMRVA